MSNPNFYKYTTLDPRPEDKVPAAKEANDAVFAQGAVLGIEVTNPKLAQRCTVGNIDPQHTEGKSDCAAIEVAESYPLPAEGTTLATIRADLDSIGSMALMTLRAQQTGERAELSEDVRARVAKIAQADKFDRGNWPGQRALPSRETPWPEGELTQTLSPIAAQISDFKTPITSRVEAMQAWLESGKTDEAYAQRVQKERDDMIGALEKGEIKVTLIVGGKVAVVESTHRAAMFIGYSQAPVVVALNPQMATKTGPIRKFTLAQFKPGYVNLKAVSDELNAREKGWGGSPTILGSPQDTSSALTTEEVSEVIEKHLAK